VTGPRAEIPGRSTIPAPGRRTKVGVAVARASALLAALLCACGGGGGGAGGPPPVPAEAFPPGIRDGPLVSRLAPTELTIAFRTTSAVPADVAYGPTPSYGAVASTVAAPEHEARLPGLLPGTTYHYRLRLPTGFAGPDHATRTPPADADVAAFRVVAVGDTGSGDAGARSVRDLVLSLAPDLVLDAGDVAYPAGTAEQVRGGLLYPYAEVLARVPLLPVWGNHDVGTLSGAPLADALVLPTNDEDGSERFYRQRWGALEVFCLDSNDDVGAGSPQRAWFARSLAASTARWRFVVFHHPAYSSSRHGSTAAIDASLVPLFDAAGVDLVINGHDHDYERTHPLRAGVPSDVGGGPDYLDPAGTIYVVTGGGGQELYPAGTSPFTARSESVRHAVAIDVTPSTLTVRAVRVGGTPIETFTITKSP